jgi:hypothetical protein
MQTVLIAFSLLLVFLTPSARLRVFCTVCLVIHPLPSADIATSRQCPFVADYPHIISCAIISLRHIRLAVQSRLLSCRLSYSRMRLLPFQAID